MITDRPTRRQPTKQRLLEEGVRLFSEKGFQETTVGEVEAAAGLEPRRGALYRHFTSKEALLEAALEQHLQVVADAGAAVEDLPVGDVRTEALNLGRLVLAELDRQRAIVRILEQEGDRLPDLRDSFRRNLVDASYRATADLSRRWLRNAPDTIDIEALSVILLGALINYRRSTWTFGASPLGVDDERFLSSWADLCFANVKALRRRTVTARVRREASTVSRDDRHRRAHGKG
jgi:AcrR family transcriptional regulator